MQQKVARYLENEIAPEEYARQQSKLLARDSQLLIHGQCCEANVDPVNEVNDEENEYERNDVCSQLANYSVFDCALNRGWTGAHAALRDELAQCSTESRRRNRQRNAGD